jgi:hypothetical protein
MWFLTFRMGSWIIRNTKKRDDLRWARELASMLQVSYIGYAVGGAFLGLAYFDLPYHLMAILVLTKTIVDKQLLEDETPSDQNNIPDVKNNPMLKETPYSYHNKYD